MQYPSIGEIASRILDIYGVEDPRQQIVELLVDSSYQQSILETQSRDSGAAAWRDIVIRLAEQNGYSPFVLYWIRSAVWSLWINGVFVNDYGSEIEAFQAVVDYIDGHA